MIDTKLSNAAGRVIVQNAGSYGQVPDETYNLAVISTGKFEKIIEEALK